jgi:predicted permease
MRRIAFTLDATFQGLKQALRRFRQAPGFTLTVIATLALGIGANATMFGIVDRLLLQPPEHVVEPDDVQRIYVERLFIDRKSMNASITYPDFRDFDAASSFAQTAVFGWSEGVTLGEGEDARRVVTRWASPSFFPLLGVQPLHGRFFGESEDVTGAASVVVLGHELWRDQFAGDPGAVGGSIRLAGRPHVIVGVAPAGFTGVQLERVDIWAPLRSPANTDADRWESSRGYYWLRAIARLAPGRTPEAAAAEATALHRAGRADDTRYDPEARVELAPLILARGPQASDESAVAGWLAGVSAVVLLIACANVANLLLARGMQRRREMGIRLAIGASRRRLFADTLAESALLAFAGGAAALAIVFWGSKLMRALLLPEIHWASSSIGVRVLGFTFGAALLAGLLAGLLPSLAGNRLRLTSSLRDGGGATRRSPARAGLMVAQAALSVVLLIGAGLFVKSLHRVRALDLGIEPAAVIAALPEFESDLAAAEQSDFFAGALERLEALPIVERAAASHAMPFWSSYATDLSVPGIEELPIFPTGGPYYSAVSPGYFETMGIRILEGRGFTAGDVDGSPRVAVVEEPMARAYWPGETALGKCLKVGGNEEPCSEIVGVAETTARQELVEEDTGQYYIPLAQQQRSAYAIFVRTAPDRVVSSLELVRAQVRGDAAGVRYVDVQPFRDYIDPQARSWQLGATMFSVFGGLALVIAAVGLYGVMAFNVAQRARELGIRSALGASPRLMLRMVLAQSVRLTALGLLIGVAAARLAGRWLQPLLFEVEPTDLTVTAGVVAVLLAVALIASLLPARRAAAVDPVVTIREQ